MKQQVGAYEAKTHLPKLLDKVSKGQEIIITRHGVPIAILRPYDSDRRFASRKLIQEFKRFRRHKRLAGLDLKGLIEEGRK